MPSALLHRVLLRLPGTPEEKKLRAPHQPLKLRTRRNQAHLGQVTSASAAAKALTRKLRRSADKTTTGLELLLASHFARTSPHGRVRQVGQRTRFALYPCSKLELPNLKDVNPTLRQLPPGLGVSVYGDFWGSGFTFTAEGLKLRLAGLLVIALFACSAIV